MSLCIFTAVAHLYKLGDGKPGNLTLFQADLLKDGSFDAAVEGCTYVFHTASPFVLQVADPQRDLVDPALLGTRTLMHRFQATKKIKKIK